MRAVPTLLLVLSAAPAMAGTGDVILSFPSSFPSPDGLTWDGQVLWATDCATSRIDKVDPATGRVVGSIDVPGVNSDELAWDGEKLWVSDHTATEMPGMGAPPPRLYRVDPVSSAVLARLEAPGLGKYPMGVAWDGTSLWNVDTTDRRIYQLDPSTGAVKRSLSSPAAGACGLTWDGACLWLTDAATDGLVYHLDAATGEVLRSFPGPGGAGHQSTGVAWDGRALWINDEATGRARVYKVEVEDITEGGRCPGALGADAGAPAPATPDGGPADGPDAGAAPGLDETPLRPACGCGGHADLSAAALAGVLALGARRRAMALVRSTRRTAEGSNR